MDASAFYAMLDRSERAHANCLSLLESHRGPIYMPILALAEVAHLVGSRLGLRTEGRLCADLAAGKVILDSPPHSDWARIAELVVRYLDLPLGMVDASIVAAAERLNVTTIATLDHHFSVVRPAHTDRFTLVP